MHPKPASLPSEVQEVTLSAAELEAGEWSRENFQRALELMHRDGIVALNGIVDVEHLKTLNDAMQKSREEALALKADDDWIFETRTNYLCSPPLTDTNLLFSDVYQNPFLLQVIEGYLGSVYQGYITCNIARAKTAERQPCHKDTAYLHPLAPYMVNAVIPLNEYTPNSGSTEFWLGTHNYTTAQDQLWKSPDDRLPDNQVSPFVREERRRVRPPTQPNVKLGAVLIRDMRSWHAGMPNFSENDRTMMGIAYLARWYPNSFRYKAPMSAKPFFTSNPKLQTLYDFYPDEEWEAFSQTWGPGGAMTVAVSPKDDGWAPLNIVTPEEKMVMVQAAA